MLDLLLESNEVLKSGLSLILAFNPVSSFDIGRLGCSRSSELLFWNVPSKSLGNVSVVSDWLGSIRLIVSDIA